MNTPKLVLLVGTVAAVVLFFYVILPKLNLSHKSGMIFRALLFFSLIGYLAYDFFLKEKYGYILVLIGGSVAFVLLMRAKKSED